MKPFFTADTVKVAYQNRFHFGWYAHGRQHRFAPLQSTLDAAFQAVAQKQNYRVLESNWEPSVLRALLSLTPFDAPAEVTRYVKGNLAAAARDRHGAADLWSRGWFVRGVGDVTNEVVQHYVRNQYAHHDAAPVMNPQLAKQAGYRYPGDASALRRSNHAAFEFNVHFVFVTRHRREFLDLQVAGDLSPIGVASANRSAGYRGKLKSFGTTRICSWDYRPAMRPGR